MKWDEPGFAILGLLVFHLIGAVGIGFQLMPAIVALSWVNLLLTAVVTFAHRTEGSFNFYLFSVMVFAVGLLVEILGVATGFPFGVYHYGDALGWKIFGVPLVLGLNWWILVYSSIHLSMLITEKKAVRLFLAPALMLCVDLLIEPLCSKLDFWYWKNPAVPVENYLSWYVISFVLIGIYFSNFKTKQVNVVAVGVFMIQVLFFSLLNVLL